MLNRTYEGQNCSVARSLELVGERWTLLILRDAFLGVRRFDDFQRRLGVARNVLAARLGKLVDDGLLERRRYSERPERFEYRLTEKAIDLWPVLHSLSRWGDRYVAPDGPPLRFVHRDCGGPIDDHRRCERCGADVDARTVVAEPGPGATPETAASLSAARTASG